ncbi:MAG: DsbE family thiol:disulfide interchange protein [Gammaproteobacteria bacterium]
MWRYIVPIALFVILGGFLGRGLLLNPGQIESPLIGKPAPAFALPDLENASARLSNEDFAGKYSLLNVWATWCAECRYEHPFLLELADSGISIYGINYKDDPEAARDWLATLGDPYETTGVDEIGDVAIDWGVYGAPETFLIGPDQTVLAKHISQLNREVWETKFAPLIESDRGDQH